MIKLTPEEQAYWDKKYDEFVKEKIKEGLEDIENGRVYTEEESEKMMKEFDEQLRRESQLKREKMKLDAQKDSTEICKRFMRA